MNNIVFFKKSSLRVTISGWKLSTRCGKCDEAERIIIKVSEREREGEE